MCAAQVVLALAAVALGLVPGLVLGQLARMLAGLPALAGGEAAAWRAVALSPASGAFAPLLLVGLALWAVGIARAGLGKGTAPVAREIWMGGVPAERGAPLPHPHGFYSPVRENLRRLYPVPRAPHVSVPRWAESAVDLDHWLYEPAVRACRPVVLALRHLHAGIPNVYIAWQLIGGVLLALLLLLLRR
jgi:hypothetical protein